MCEMIPREPECARVRVKGRKKGTAIVGDEVLIGLDDLTMHCFAAAAVCSVVNQEAFRPHSLNE